MPNLSELDSVSTGGGASTTVSGAYRSSASMTALHRRTRGLKRANTLRLLPSRIVSRIYGAVNHMTLYVACLPRALPHAVQVERNARTPAACLACTLSPADPCLRAHSYMARGRGCSR